MLSDLATIKLSILMNNKEYIYMNDVLHKLAYVISHITDGSLHLDNR